MIMRTYSSPSHHQYLAGQAGAALILSLILLLLMTIIGVTAAKVTTQNEKMAGNMRDRELAFQAAESALRDAEASLTVAVLASFNGSNGLYQASTPQKWEVVDWSNASEVIAFSGTALQDVTAQPTYIIEEMEPVLGGAGSLEAGTPQQTDYYRVTARGIGGTDTAVVLLQSIYKR